MEFFGKFRKQLEINFIIYTTTTIYKRMLNKLQLYIVKNEKYSRKDSQKGIILLFVY
jgi:hypothetical protein